MKYHFRLLIGFFCLFTNLAFAHSHSKHRESDHLHHNNYATFSRSNLTPDDWIDLETNSYPETTPLSLNANEGDSRGHVYPSPTGITIGEKGDYYVQIAAVVQNPDSTETILIPAFLAVNENFDLTPNLTIGGIVTLHPEEIGTVNSFGILKDLEEGSRLSIVVTNAGYPTPIPLRVVAWRITAIKL